MLRYVSSNLSAPARRAEGSHFSSGKKSADELILMKELDTEDDCAQRVVRDVCVCVCGEGAREKERIGVQHRPKGQGKQMLQWRY